MVTSSPFPNDNGSSTTGQDMSATPAKSASSGSDPTKAAADAAHAAVDQAADMASTAASRMHDGVDAVRGAINRSIDEVCDCSARCTEATREAVRAKPITAIAVSMGIGLLIGRLCR